ncbi:unnamed protein product [Linum trigynum]|uniref:Uncharacterized protein n=1 Tax=Linum trigynum TaxID=586398 RepID=A0AAV2DQD7_9ROSI
METDGSGGELGNAGKRHRDSENDSTATDRTKSQVLECVQVDLNLQQSQNVGVISSGHRPSIVHSHHLVSRS